MKSGHAIGHTENTLPSRGVFRIRLRVEQPRERCMLSRFTEQEIKELVRKVDELHAKFPTLDDYWLSEVFLSENRARLNRREPNSACETTELVMARWRKETGLRAARDGGKTK